MQYITQEGEITTKEELINEIENLLNLMPSDNPTKLSFAVMNALECADLECIRNRLLQNDAIEKNRQWLLNLASKDTNE